MVHFFLHGNIASLKCPRDESMNDSVATNTELVYGQQNIWTDSFTKMFQCQNVKSIGMKSGVDGWMKPRSRKLGLEGCRGSALLCRVLFCCVSTLTVTLLLPGMTLPRRVVLESMARGLLLCTRAYLSTGSAHRARLSLRGRRWVRPGVKLGRVLWSIKFGRVPLGYRAEMEFYEV